MPRLARMYMGGGVFHILTKGNNKQWVFQDKKDFEVYRKILKELKKEHPCKLYHYCLMSNHVHLVIETNKETELSTLMKRINLSYYSHYKRRYGYAGHFWQGRFKSLLIEKDEYLLACGLYVERNPVRAKIVDKAEKYPYSSYLYYGYGEDNVLVDTDPYYETLGKYAREKQKNYRDLILDKQKGINETMFNQLFLGTEKFIKAMEDKFKMRNNRLKIGRPKKK